MTHWFDAQAAKSRRLRPEQRHKIRLIKEALGKSDSPLHVHFTALNGFEQSAIRFGPDPKYAPRVAPEWLTRLSKLRDELLRARDHLDALNTGLRAERELIQALMALAAGVAAWQDGLGSTDVATIERARVRMQRHFATAEPLCKAGLAHLEQGR